MTDYTYKGMVPLGMPSNAPSNRDPRTIKEDAEIERLAIPIAQRMAGEGKSYLPFLNKAIAEVKKTGGRRSRKQRKSRKPSRKGRKSSKRRR